MFTGIIEGFGNIVGIRTSGLGRRLTVDADFDLGDTKIGDSLSVSGACLTAVTVEARRFQADVSPETLDKTTFQKTNVGERVNIERALMLTDRLDGHLVSGHVDCIGTIMGRKPVGNATIITIEVPPSLSPYIIEKGSIAVDGISLTVNHCIHTRFDVSIIPHTGMLTTIGHKKVGERVNIETDMIGKYVKRFLSHYHNQNNSKETGGSHIGMDLLAKTGFLNPGP
ncbi:MAG: riboflavin synthase [Deltaproteobacteria bacterium]|nr:riboflavin synthase [Deltaproteobacteria bacterium]